MPSRTEDTIKHAAPMNRNRGAGSGKGREVGFEATRRSEHRARSNARRPGARRSKTGS